MKNDKETKNKLLASAAEEFMEKGYTQASLRNICKKVGVTTGALYFFFQDKEDLFASLVEEPVHRIYELMKQHYIEEKQRKKALTDDDVKVAKQVVEHMYENRDVFLLLLTKSQGSRYEKIKEQFVAITEKHYQELMKGRAAEAGGLQVDDYMIHWCAHMTIDIFVHMLTHEPSKEEALKHMESIMRLLMKGWEGLI